ncbi:MAG: glutathione S-transferase N-terminal domain-containing protein [Hyphomicrobiaceae bacterium]
MMILRSSPPSPFGRKVKLAASHLGLMDRIRVEVADTTDPKDSLVGQNPLAKIPTLVLEDGTCLYDSRVIVEYLDWLAGGGRLIPAAPARWRALQLAALADGIMEAALLLVYEKRIRPKDQWNAQWMDNQQGKIARGLAALEAAPPPLAVEVGQIGLACALGYLDLRHEGAWRTSSPRLVGWLDGLANLLPAFEETRVKT